MNKRLSLLTFLLLLPLLGGTGCKNNREPEKPKAPEASLLFKEKTVNYEEGAQTATIQVARGSEWTASVAPDGATWCQTEQKNGELILHLKQNEQKNIRETHITLSTQADQAKLTVQQLGWGKDILISTTSVEAPALGGAVVVEVTANVEWEAVWQDAPWVSLPKNNLRSDHPMVTKECKLLISSNMEAKKRVATITIADKEKNSQVEPKEFTITQQDLSNYSEVKTDGIKDDIKLKVKNGTASSSQNGEGIEKSFDGNQESIYHSKWDNSAPNYFPIYLEYNLDTEEGETIEYLIYYPRTDASLNGRFKEVDIEVKTADNNNWTKVKSYDFKAPWSATRVVFDEPLKGVLSVRFVVKSGAGDGQGFASCAEMEFFKSNPENFNPLTLFTDNSCSELKPGITEQDIFECKHDFFKNLALFIYHDHYPKEFRIATYNATWDPYIQTRINKTIRPYSRLDNPTGIAAEEGKDLIVCVAGLNGQQASIRVQNLDKPDGDGFGGEVYPLKEGINKIEVQKKGLIYIEYVTDNPPTSTPIKVHFASGTVNGYYNHADLTHKGRAKELLEAATDNYFDVLGTYSHLIFPTATYRTHSKDLEKLVEAYDTIVFREQEFQGNTKYNKMARNRMCFTVMYHSYMYATNFHTAYTESTLSEIANPDLLTTRAIWGPAHEVGHMNQTYPIPTWHGMTEVSNNILSLHMQTSVYNQPSRLQSEDMGSHIPNRYAKAINSIIVEGKAHVEEGDVFCKLVPLWQLELYFGKVLGRTPLMTEDHGGFYPDLYEYIRTHDMPRNGAGNHQLEFTYIASKISGYDLTDFFEKWGFFKPVSLNIDDYGKGWVTVTKEASDNVKARIKALNLPKLDVALEYITDISAPYFKAKGTIEKGTASRDGNVITTKGWKNVVAYEVVDSANSNRVITVSDGKLKESSTAQFKLQNGHSWQPSYKVYAVAWDNSRVEVTF